MNQSIPPYPGAAMPRPAPQTAIWSLVTGVLAWFCLPVVGAILAVILGFSARSEARRYGQSTPGTATAGLVLGFIQLGLVGLFVAFWIVSAIVAIISNR